MKGDIMADIVKIDEGTWRFEDGFVRFFLVEGDDKAALIDSGANCPDALELAKTLTDKDIILLNTHGDGDHTSGTSKFSCIYIHPADFTGCEVDKRYPETKLVEIKDGDLIDLGNRPLRIIHIPGHTKGSVAILDVNRRALFAGDSVQKGHIYMFGEKRQPELFEASLDKLIALNAEYDSIYASHDEYLLPGDYAEKVKKAWRQVMSGNAPFEIIDLFGNKVRSYTTDDCGFYMEDRG